MKDELKTRAAKILAHYPKANTVHFTSDGSPFTSEQAAKAHAKGLKDTEVISVQRHETATPDEGKPASPATKPVGKMNASELKELATSKGIEVPEGATKKDIIALLDAAEATTGENAGETAPEGKE